MKSAMFKIWTLGSLLLGNLESHFHPAFADSNKEDNPCSPIFLACEDKGYTYDKVAQPGQKIWADCADLIINQNQEVRGLRIDATRVKLCKQYKKSKDTWEENYKAHHPVGSE
jgi:hypothetical protein